MAPKVKGKAKAKAKDAAARKAEEEAAKAAKAEAARLEALRLEEEARLEKIRQMERELATPEGMIKDLKRWFYTIPLSQPDITKIERDFSDGVLVAEILAHYRPDICDSRHFFRCYSYQNKWSNWSNLNRKVFPEIDIHLTEATICNLMQPFSVNKRDPKAPKEPAIFTLLKVIREKMKEFHPDIFDYRNDPPENPDRSKQKPRITSSKRNPLYPQMSKIEMWLESGHYDEQQGDKPDGCCIADDSNSNWVSVYLTGGEILLDGAPEVSPLVCVQPPQICEQITD